MKKKMIKKILKPSWIKDLIALGKDAMYLVRDVTNDVSHLIVRFLKLITAVSIWGKDLSKDIEFMLKGFRTNLKMNK